MSNTTEKRFATVGYGERIDQLAGRLLGDPNRWREIAQLNPNLDIKQPKAGQVIQVPSE